MRFARASALLILAGCAVAPPSGTNFERMRSSLYHIDHPEYGRPMTRAETRADFTGTHPVPSKIGLAAAEADAKRCDAKIASLRQDLQVTIDVGWACMWRKGWRWDTDAAPSP